MLEHKLQVEIFAMYLVPHNEAIFAKSSIFDFKIV